MAVAASKKSKTTTGGAKKAQQSPGTDAPKKPPGTGEISIADTRRGLPMGFRFAPYNPDDLVRRKGGLQIYDAMRIDDQVKACLMLKKCAIVGPGWKLEPANPKDKRAKEQADTYTKDLLGIKGTFEARLMDMLTCFDYGFSVSEILWKVDERIVIKDVKTRAPHAIDFQQDPGGNILSIWQQQIGVTGQGGIPPQQAPLKVGYKPMVNGVAGYAELPTDKFVVLSYRGEFANPYGNSDLREAYKPWWYKTNWMQWWAVFAEKLSDPPLLGKHPLNAGKTKVDELMAILEHLQARTAITIPEGWDLDLLETTRDPKTMFESAINRFDQAISRALLVPDRLGLTPGSGGGSYAMSRTQLGSFFFVLQLLVGWLEDEIQKQLVDRMVEYNEGPDADKPKFRLLPLNEENKESIAQLWNSAVQAGSVMSDLEDENHLRALLGFPEKDEREQAMQDLLMQKQLALPAPGAGDGGPPGGGKGKPGANGQGGLNPKGSLKGPRGGGLTKPGLGPSGKKPAGGVPGKKPGGAKFTERPLTPVEERADMDEKRRAFDALTPPLAQALATGAEQLVAHLKAQVAAGVPPAALDVPPDLRDAVRGDLHVALAAAFARGKRQAVGELARARRQFVELEARQLAEAETLAFRTLGELFATESADAALRAQFAGVDPTRLPPHLRARYDALKLHLTADEG